jgi:hypothetical protein
LAVGVMDSLRSPQVYVYLLHFERPISPKHTCQHYIGSAEDLHHRLHLHRTGLGARLTQVALERGITFTLAKVWIGGRDLERKLKNRHNAPLLCPICNGSRAQMSLLLDFTLDDVEEIAF